MNNTIEREVLRIVLWGVGIVLTFSLCLWIWGDWHDDWSGYNASITISDGSCNIAVVPVMGDISVFDSMSDSEEAQAAVANADEVLSYLHAAEWDPYVTGILVRIDSYGGSPVASELIADAIKRSSLPTVALIREAGTSGGYLIATGADTVIASPFSDVGGIGVSMSYLENWQQNESAGLGYVSLASAPYKDYGNPDKPLTAAERELLERDLGIWHQHFVDKVAENRGLPLETVTALADGSSVPGAIALESKLIDTLGDQESARTWFADELGVSADDIAFCE